MAEKTNRRRTCAVMEHHHTLAAADPVYRQNRRNIEAFTATARLRPTGVVRIPVVVHVLYNTDEENLSKEQIDSQIRVLNQDFRCNNTDVENIPAPFRPLAADLGIEFALAVRDPDGNATTGITRTRTTEKSFGGATAQLDTLIKFDGTGKKAWPADRYLNMWVCNLAGGLLGYAQFPGGPPATDGVVITYDAFGLGEPASAPFDKGRTATHEVGHYFNLLHIWGDDGGGCSGSDNVDDTPNQAGPNTATPEFPHVSCDNAPHGDMFMNYMDYVDDGAMFMFTLGQRSRAHAALAGPRASLLESDGLQPVETAPLALDRTTVAAGMRRLASDNPGVSKIFDGVEWQPRAMFEGAGLPAVDPSQLQGEWTKVPRARAGEAKFVRAAENPVRARLQPERLVFDSSGDVSKLVPGPADGPLAMSGQWQFTGDGRLVVDFDNGNGSRWEVVSADGEQLVLRAVAP